MLKTNIDSKITHVWQHIEYTDDHSNRNNNARHSESN